MDKVKLIKEVLGSFFISNDEHLFYCPYCKHHKRKLSINFEKNFFKCWTCDAHGRNLRRLVKRFGNFKQLQVWDKFNNREDVTRFDEIFDFSHKEGQHRQRISLPEEFVTLTGKDHPTSAIRPLKYLENRGFTKEDVIRWKIGYCVRGNYENRIIVPSFDIDGYVNYFIARTYNGDWRKYLNPSLSKDIVFNHLYIDWDSDIILVEGVFDAVMAGPNSIPLLGSTLREDSKLFQEIVKNDAAVFLALDPDAEKKTNNIISKFLEYGIETYVIDVSGFDDVGEMTKEEFDERKQSASFVGDDDYLFLKKLVF